MAAYRMLRFSLAVVVLGAGCGTRHDPSFPTWAAKPTPVVIESASANAFDAYASAAAQLESSAQTHLRRVSFFPAQRAAAMRAASEPFQQVLQATQKPCELRFAPHRPFEPVPYVQGWRLIGRVFAWKIEDACKAADYEAAVSLATAGSKFGFDLTGGGAVDASLGCSIVDEVRKAIAPHLPEMGAAQLNRLAEGVGEALARRAPTEQTLAHEHENTLQAVQAVQDSYREGTLDELGAQLGSSAKDAVDYLQDLKKKDSKRPQYFEGFAHEADAVSEALIRQSKMPASARKSDPGPALVKERPWWRFALHFFGSGKPLLALLDATVARTRLLALTSLVMAKQKASGAYPESLAEFGPRLNTDPYSGQPFLYHADPAQFSLYSVGPDFKDDGGDTDDSFSSPDLTLEGSPD